MSEPSKKPQKPKRPNPNLPDDQAIRQLFPKRVVEGVNKAIDHTPTHPPKSPKTPKNTGDK